VVRTQDFSLGTRYNLQSLCEVCCHCQKERENRYVFSSAAQNDATLGGAAVKSGKAFHARVAAMEKNGHPMSHDM